MTTLETYGMAPGPWTISSGIPKIIHDSNGDPVDLSFDGPHMKLILNSPTMFLWIHKMLEFADENNQIAAAALLQLGQELIDEIVIKS